MGKGIIDPIHLYFSSNYINNALKLLNSYAQLNYYSLRPIYCTKDEEVKTMK